MELPGVILELATSHTRGPPGLPFRRANGLYQGPNRLPDMIRNCRPGRYKAGQVGVRGHGFWEFKGAFSGSLCKPLCKQGFLTLGNLFRITSYGNQAAVS